MDIIQGGRFLHSQRNIRWLPWYLNNAFQNQGPTERFLLMSILIHVQISATVNHNIVKDLEFMCQEHWPISSAWSLELRMKSARVTIQEGN